MTWVSKAYTDRIAKPWYLKLFVPWWFYNSFEPTAPEGYKPDSAYLVRQVFWYLRNPLVNFADNVIGVQDRNYVAYGQDPVDVTDWLDIGRSGWKFGVIHIAKVFWLPYVSFTGKRVLWHIGWYATGSFQIKFNLLGHGESPY